MDEVEKEARELPQLAMKKILASVLSLTCLSLGMVDFHRGVIAQDLNLAELPESLQRTICMNDWGKAIHGTNLLIANSTTAPEYREQLINFRYQLQDWRATEAKVSPFKGCEAIASLSDPPATTYDFAAPLNFSAGMRSIEALRSLPSGYIGYEGIRGTTAPDRNCWVIDASGRRTDLTALCR